MVSERLLIPGLYLTIVNNYKIIIVPNDSLNPAHLIVIAQAKPQPKDQLQVTMPFRLAHTHRPQMCIHYINHYHYVNHYHRQ